MGFDHLTQADIGPAQLTITDNALPKQAVHGRVPGPGPLVDRPNRADPNCRCFLIQEHRRSGASRALCL